MYKVESKTFLRQDLTVTLPVTNENEARYVNPSTPAVLDMGSPYDDGASLPPQKPQSGLSETTPTGTILQQLPPTVIEISANEEEMLQKLEVVS